MKNMSKIITGHNKKVISKPCDQSTTAEKKHNVHWKGTVKLTT